MPSARAIDAGRAVLRVVALDGGVRAVLNDIEGALQQTAARVRNVGLAIAATGVAGLGSFTAAIREAARAEEIASKFSVVFGDAQDSVRAFFRTLSDEVGRSEGDLQAFGAGFQDLLQPIGFDPASARQFSQSLTELAVDLGSFNNRNDADVVRDLQAALTGSSETMKRYGVIVNEAAVNQQLLNDNIDPSDASEVDRVYARLAIIFRQTTTAQGDAARTAGSFTNQTKALSAAARDASVAVGQSLLPVVTPIVSGFRELVIGVRNIAQAFPGLTQLMAAASIAFTAIGAGITAVGLAASALLSPITLLSIAANALGISLTGVTFTTARAAVGMLTFANASRVASVALTGLLGVTRAFLLSPIGILLTASTVALTLFAGGMSSAAAASREASTAISQAAAAIGSVGDASRAAAELEELSRASSLTSEQQARANDLLNTIGQNYSTFGIAVDEATGKIVAQEGAFRKLFDLLSQLQVQDLETATQEQSARVAELELALARAEEGARRGGQGRQASGRRAERLRGELDDARAEAARLRGELAKATQGRDATGATRDGSEPTESELQERDRLNERFARQARDAEIAAIEDTRQRRIAAARESADRDIAEAERAGARKADIERRLALEIDSINRESDAQKQREEQRLADRRRQETASAEQRATDAETSLIADPRERELTALEEYRRREIELAEGNARRIEAIDQEVAARRVAINQRFDEIDRQRADRAAQRAQRDRLQLARSLEISGTLATRAAGQQFSRGGDDIARSQLSELRDINKRLKRISRQPNGLRVL